MNSSFTEPALSYIVKIGMLDEEKVSQPAAESSYKERNKDILGFDTFACRCPVPLYCLSVFQMCFCVFCEINAIGNHFIHVWQDF